MDYLEGCKTDGIEPREPFSGNIVLRMPSYLHEQIALNALSYGTTINDYIVHTLEDAPAPPNMEVIANRKNVLS